MYANRPILTCSLLLASVGFTACAEELELEPADLLAGEEGSTLRSAVNFPVKWCSTGNVIGMLDGPSPTIGTCDLGGALLGSSWAWHRMFQDSTPELAVWTELPPGELLRFCSYEYVGAEDEPNDDDYQLLFGAITAYPWMSLDSVGPDCRAQVGMGTGLDDPAVIAPLAAAFEDAIQWVSATDLGLSSSNRSFAMTAVIDSLSQLAHDDPTIDPVSEHGGLMGTIIEKIACPRHETACLKEVRYHVALPREEHLAGNWINGGDIGTRGDAAAAVVAAVGQFRMHQLAFPTASTRLVINASVGLIPDAPGGELARGPASAYEQALYFAACNGALVVAAAGNIWDPLCTDVETGPLSPAAFEDVLAPTQAECDGLGYAPLGDPTTVFGGARPLVQAMGGVDGHDQPIINSRLEGMPQIAAYAASVSVQTGSNDLSTAVTGTSVAAAVGTGLASLIWSYAPALTPTEVMQIIYDSGFDTGLQADFGVLGASEPVHRVSVCAALELACSTLPAGHCPALDCGDGQAPADGHLSGFAVAVADAIADPSNTVEVFPAGSGVAPMCTPSAWDEKLNPQPDHPLCPHCSIDKPPTNVVGDDILSMTIDHSYGDIATATLVTYDATGASTVYELSPDVVASLNDPAVTITQVTLPHSTAVTASLSFLVGVRPIDGPIPVVVPAPV